MIMASSVVGTPLGWQIDGWRSFLLQRRLMRRGQTVTHTHVVCTHIHRLQGSKLLLDKNIVSFEMTEPH